MESETEHTSTHNRTSTSAGTVADEDVVLDPSSSQLDVHKSDVVEPTPARGSYFKIGALTVLCGVLILAILLIINYGGSSAASAALRTEWTVLEDTKEEMYIRHRKSTAEQTITETTTDDSDNVPSGTNVTEPTSTIPEDFTGDERTSEWHPSAVPEITSHKGVPSKVTKTTAGTSEEMQESSAVDNITTFEERKESSREESTLMKASTAEVASKKAVPKPSLNDTGDMTSARGVLLCTAGDFAVSEVMFPPDGLCNLLFYTHVWFLEGDIHGRFNEKSWETFKKLAPASDKTGFGISASYDDADGMRAALGGTGRAKMKELHKKRIIHYGILRAEGNSTSFKKDLSGRLQLISDFTKLQEEINGPSSKIDEEVVLGVRFTEYLNKGEVAKHSAVITELTRKLPITMFIIQTHVDKRIGLTPVIGTMLDQWDDVERPPLNAPTLVETLSSLQAATVAEDIQVLLSFTMLVGRFWLNQSFTLPPSTWQATSWKKDGFDMTCKNNATLEMTSSCTLRFLGVKANELLCFEDSDTMVEKARRVKFEYKINSWAIFDVEFEDHDNACGRGAFERIKELKRSLKHFI